MTEPFYNDEPLAPYGGALVERTKRSGEVVYRSSVYVDRKRVFETFYDVTRTQAKARHKARIADAAKGDIKPRSVHSIGELKEQAFAHYQAILDNGGSNGKPPRISQGTLDNYVAMWNRIALFQPGGKDILTVRADAFDRPMARAYLKWLADQKLAPSTQNGHKSAMAAVLRYGRDSDILSIDPFHGLPRDEQPNQKPRAGWVRRVFSAQEVAAICAAAQTQEFLDVTPGVMLSNVVTLLAYSGMRLSEATGLRWGSVREDGVILVREQRMRQKGGEQAKTKQTLKHREEGEVRPVAMFRPLRVAMEAQATHELEKGRGLDEHLIFTDAIGKPITNDQAKDAVNRATRIAGLGSHGPQTLRRSYCTALAQSNVPAATAAAATGHTVEVYYANYVKPILDAKQLGDIVKAAEAFGFGVEEEA